MEGDRASHIDQHHVFLISGSTRRTALNIVYNSYFAGHAETCESVYNGNSTISGHFHLTVRFIGMNGQDLHVCYG